MDPCTETWFGEALVGGQETTCSLCLWEWRFCSTQVCAIKPHGMITTSLNVICGLYFWFGLAADNSTMSSPCQLSRLPSVYGHAAAYFLYAHLRDNASVHSWESWSLAWHYVLCLPHLRTHWSGYLSIGVAKCTDLLF